MGMHGLLRVAGDGDRVVYEFAVVFGERDRLNRLRRRPQMAHDVVAVQEPVRRGDVYEVNRLDDVTAPHDYPERTHAKEGSCRNFPRSRPGGASSTPTSSALRSRRQALRTSPR